MERPPGARLAPSVSDYAEQLADKFAGSMDDRQREAVERVVETGEVSQSDYEQALSDYRQCMIDRGYREIIFLDVGGGAHGSHMIGQFSHILSRESTRVLYIVNPYRPWSRSLEEIERTAERVAGAARLTRLHLVANPNLGPETDAGVVVEGLNRFRALFPERTPEFVCVPEGLCADAEQSVKEPILPIRLNTLPEWMVVQERDSDMKEWSKNA